MISAEYLAEQQRLHESPKYGVASINFAPTVADLIRQFRFKSLHDYGAGKQRLREELERLRVPVAYSAYDPVFPEYGAPQSAELVCCIDVLEHIEIDSLEAVLQELASITTHLGFFSIHMGPAAKVLSDGRNAHLIQEPSSWWLPRLCRYFDILHLVSHNMMGKGFWIIVRKRAEPH
jgi:hypothetical protein